MDPGLFFPVSSPGTATTAAGTRSPRRSPGTRCWTPWA